MTDTVKPDAISTEIEVLVKAGLVTPGLASLLKALQSNKGALVGLVEDAQIDEDIEGVATVNHSATKERWAIVIDEAHDSTDTQDVFVQVNGRAYRMQRGVVVNVPKEVMEALDHAIYYVTKAVIDPITGLPNGMGEPKKVRRFPYQKFYQTIDKTGARIADDPVVEAV